MTISYVSSSAVEASSITLPTHQAGDLIVMYASVVGTSTITIPSGWNRCTTRINSAGLGSVTAWKIASSNSETSGTWTNAGFLCAGVWRHSSNLIIVGSRNLQRANSTTTVTYPAVLSSTSSGSAMAENNWVAAFGLASLNNTDFETAPSGMTNRTSLAGASSGEVCLHDTNSNVTSWSQTSRTNSGSVAYDVSIFSIENTGISKAGGKPILPFTQGVIG